MCTGARLKNWAEKRSTEPEEIKKTNVQKKKTA